jgi:hypothetical protein
MEVWEKLLSPFRLVSTAPDRDLGEDSEGHPEKLTFEVHSYV